jgi:mRNA (2'-O-methyladenosine-N6-)-methyltransferase
LNTSKTEEEEETTLEVETFEIPEHCVPIRTDIRVFDFDALAKEAQFDVIMMDPPWLLASSAPTRGVALGYKQLPNNDIQNIPVLKLQTRGFLFIWVINARYSFALDLMKEWGYTFVDDITWVKSTVNRRLAKGHGFYLQHAKETCLVGRKGPQEDLPFIRHCLESDVIYAERRGQSQKPEQIYELVEALVPGGKYLEIFARRNNLRNYWVSIGLEL